MLSLTDPQWFQFKANYTDGGQVACLLARAEAGEALEDWYDDLQQELCHQYTVSDAAYPAGPHLARLAAEHEELRLHLLLLLGVCHAFSEPAATRPLPDGVREEWRASAAEAMPLIAELLSRPLPGESEVRYLLSALAAVHGYPALACVIEGFDDLQE
jgi:hypothetical protein